MPWEASEVEDHAGRGPEAVEIIGFGLEAQADAAISGDAAQADVLGADFHAQAVHPVLAVRPAALAVHPLIAGRREDHAAFPGPRAEASLHAIFPVDVAETLGRIALDADEDGAERHVDARDAADDRAVHDRLARNAAEFGAPVEAVIAAQYADIGFDAEGLGAVGSGFLLRRRDRGQGRNQCGRNEIFLHEESLFQFRRLACRRG
ncbi:hypothetical protein AI27_08420 [Sphingomonas sp. BHC-A]|nr:hypothetical protein AI27_08420 [Sphingomonas sp. BHC-A]